MSIPRFTSSLATYWADPHILGILISVPFQTGPYLAVTVEWGIITLQGQSPPMVVRKKELVFRSVAWRHRSAVTQRRTFGLAHARAHLVVDVKGRSLCCVEKSAGAVACATSTSRLLSFIECGAPKSGGSTVTRAKLWFSLHNVTPLFPQHEREPREVCVSLLPVPPHKIEPKFILTSICGLFRSCVGRCTHSITKPALKARAQTRRQVTQ